MLGMSNEQVFALIRQILPVLGGVAVGLGWLTQGQFDGGAAVVLQLMGPAMIIGSTIWSLVKNTKSSLVATVAAMPEVNSVKLEPTIAGNVLSNSTPANVTVVPSTTPPKAVGL